MKDEDAWSEYQRNETVVQTVVLQVQEAVLKEAAPEAKVQKEPLKTYQRKTDSGEIGEEFERDNHGIDSTVETREGAESR